MPELQASQYSGLYTLVLYVLPPATGTAQREKGKVYLYRYRLTKKGFN